MEQIPLVDLRAQHAEIADELDMQFADVMNRTAFIGGDQVAAFESAFADFVGATHCVGVANGTDALELALRAIGVEAGDEVVVPANTFVATAEAVARAGARPVLVDVDPDALLMDPDLVPDAITSRTRAVIPVHLYGQAAPVELLEQRLDAGRIAIVEDAAQSQGARRFGRATGALGLVAGTSFYPGKNLGAYGDAGAVLTSSPEIARLCRMMSAHGGERRYEHPVLGFNSRLDTLQAVVLLAKLSRLTAWNAARVEAAERYDKLLADVDGLVLPSTLEGNEPVWHLYVVRVEHRDAVLAHLHSAGVGAAVHYPQPVHMLGAFAYLGYERGSFPVAEKAVSQILSLPIYPHITPAQQERVVEALVDAIDACS
jgi:dTDP-4-amino-4,6-dideoxygalactose transaminase